MRLWHKDLINVLPEQQLLSQWKDCCTITKNIAVNGTPNHILVNPVMDYPIEKDFCMYCLEVIDELGDRDLLNRRSINNWINNINNATNDNAVESNGSFFRIKHFDRNYKIFYNWHNENYLTQCYYNLQEQHDRGGISDEDWDGINNKYNRLIILSEEKMANVIIEANKNKIISIIKEIRSMK